MKGTALLEFNENGIFCPKGDFYIDPWKPVARAIITHGHSDHSRPGNKNYLCHQDSVPILKHRLGEIAIESLTYGEKVSINGVSVSLYPAGHLLGSAQVRLEYQGEVWCVSGDYKLEPDPIAQNFEPVTCHTFITECTFGLPVYHWPKPEEVMKQVSDWWRSNQQDGKISLLSAYSLGKAQRILESLDDSIGPIYVHGAIHNLNDIYRRFGFLKKEMAYLSNEITKSDLEGSLVLAPPSAVGSSFARKLQPFSVGVASGWMTLRGSKRRQNVDRGFVLSDHADWSGLNQAIALTGANRIICTHGYTSVFSEWLRSVGYEALEERTYFEPETQDVLPEE